MNLPLESTALQIKKKPSSWVAGGVPINRLGKGNACDVHITGAMVQCLERPHCSR